jgi:ribosome-associated heat shock protein Hsp15
MQAGRQRIDRWLFFARIVKSRSLGAKLVELGRVRVNGRKIEKSADCVQVGDGLTLNMDRRIAVLRVLALGERRGPAPEARLLYEDLSARPEKREGERELPDAVAPLRKA